MQNLSGVKLFAIAILAGILAVAAGYYYLHLREEQLRNAYMPKSDITVALVVPSVNMAIGEILSQDKLSIKRVPVDYVPSNALTAELWKQASGRTLASPVQRGRPITWDAIEGDSVDRFSENITIGKRAKTIKISKVDSIDGLLRPGDRIDVYGKFSSGDIGVPSEANFADDVLLLIMENIEVLAAGREDATGRKYEKFIDQTSADGFNMSFTTVTLHVSEYQAAKLELAQEAGELISVLRNPEDTGVTNTLQLRVSDLLRPDPVEKVRREQVVRDAAGNIVGRVVDGKVLDKNGKVIGGIKNGVAMSLDGKPLGELVAGESIGQVVPDAEGNIVGRIVDGKVLDENGKVIGEVKDGVAMSLDGKRLGVLSASPEARTADANANRYFQFIAGGKGEDGVNAIQKVLVE
jgi:Flp pilus assembly protein CpaB